VVSADAASVEISASNVTDPVPDLLAWLERLVEGGAARVLIDEEGEQTETLVYPKGQGLVRFVLFRYGENDEKRLDLLLTLRDVVVQFYAALQELARDEAVFKNGWLFHVDWNSVAQPPFSRRPSRRSCPASARAERRCRQSRAASIRERRTYKGELGSLHSRHADGH
jgi:hypothetical protein